MILYQQSYLTIEYEENLQCLIQHWKGFATSEQFRDGINQSITYFTEKKINKLISNTKELAVIKKEDTDWVAAYATPIMVQHGLQYMAFIVPTNIFTQVSVSNFKSKAEDMLQIQYFNDLHIAIHWLSNTNFKDGGL